MTDLIVDRNSLPDWSPTKAIVMVYPHKVGGRERLVPFYHKFLTMIPDNVKIVLLVKDISCEDKIRTWCVEAGIHNEIDIQLAPDLFDIWIRDYAPLNTQESGIKIPVKFLYKPSYVGEKYKNNVKNDDQLGELLGAKLVFGAIRSVEFIWDLGNLTHNGEGVAIISNKFIADNQTNNIDHELRSILHIFCGFSKIIFIPTEPGDDTGHVDGMVRFIDKKILVVGAYPAGSPNHTFMDLLAKNLEQDLDEDYTIIRLMNGECEEIETEGIVSAFGNHLNFLRLGNKILCPYYGDEISKEPIEKFKSELIRNQIDIEVVPVEIPGLKELARMGGVLNCITWQVFH